ncbi:hypothetical protein E2C06_17725 [Dankookia rubra]|uniref:Uncharacterized protein n=1 Tax=Dankookia rubra TaxID=1442381 RepID=A0A4R5QED0_9PROT|nr:hypothetical protein E2C06_17725 [Dankookia rubra]
MPLGPSLVAQAEGWGIEADVLAFHKAQGPGYLTRMNRDLRAAMLQNLQRRILPKGRQVG